MATGNRRRPYRAVVAAVAVMLVATGIAPAVRAIDPTPTPAPKSTPNPQVGPVAPLFPPPGQPPTANVPLPYSADDFSYDVVAHGAKPTFHQVGYVDPDFEPGNAPFGTDSGCPLGPRIRTAWAINTDLLLRKTVDLPQGGTNLVVAVSMDNDVRVYWQGTEITPGAAVVHEGCAIEDQFIFQIPDNLIQTGDNLLAVRAIDRGSDAFADVSVRIEALLAAPEDRFGRCGPTPEQNTQPICQAEPVNSLTGAYTTYATDLTLPGRGVGVDLARSYSSADTGASPLGPGWTHSYNARLVFQGDGSVYFIDPNGATVPFYSDGAGGYYPALGVRATLFTSGTDLIVQRPDRLRYRFNATGQLTGVLDRNGNTISLAYTGGQLTSLADTVGRTVSFGYDASQRLNLVTDSTGRSVGYSYHPSGHLATVTDLRGKVTTYTYDAGGRLATITDPNLHTLVTNTYGPSGRVIEQVDALGNHTQFAWDQATTTATMTDARTGQWVDQFTGGVLTMKRDPLGNTTTFAYDAMLNAATVTNARGLTTTRYSDAHGNLLRTVAPAPLNYSVTFEYDLNDQLHGLLDGRGNRTWFDYDAAGNLIRRTDPGTGSPQTTFAYDPSGNGLVLSMTDPRGKTTSYAYDSQANLASVTTPLGFKTTMTYDPAGRVASRVDPRGNVIGADPNLYRTTFTHDAAGNLLTVTDPLSHTTETGYDDAGNRTSLTDANDHVTSYGYDNANHLTSVTDPRLKVTSYTYDPVGNVATRTDAKSHTTSYGYDLANRLTSETRPLGRLWAYTYDANGNRTTIVDAIGNSTPQTGDGTTTFIYDNVDRVSRISYSDGTPLVTYGYDANSNRTSMTDGVSNSYIYDAMNRVTQALRSPNLQMNYTYDPAGNVLTRTPLGGSAMTYTYDDDGRMATVSDPLTTTYGYDAAGNLLSTTLPTANGYVETRTYDTAGRLSEVKNTKGANVLSRSTYTLDPVGNRATIVTTTGTTTLTYDENDRLTQACYTPACTGSDNFRRYTYDDVGNRLTEVSAAGTTSYTYDALDQLNSTSGLGGNVAYSYDLNGSQTAAGSRTFTYDLARRTKTTTLSSTTTTYTYDGDGRRIKASTGSQAAKNTIFLWDSNRPLGQLVRELDGNNALLREYQYGLDLVSMRVGGSAYFFHHDGLGSVVNVTSGTGVTQWTYQYHPFGTSRTTTKNNNQAPANLVQFTGEYLDPTGLYHLRARQYDPATGRFISTDPVSLPITDPYIAGYVYVGQNPVLLTDPSGRCFGPLIFLAPACIGAVVGAVSYVVSTVGTNVVTNVVENRDPTHDLGRGLNPVDGIISAGAGVLGGPLGGIAYGPTRVLSGVALGCSATFASQGADGRTGDLLETGIGCAAGGAGSILKLGSAAANFVYGAIVAVAQGTATYVGQGSADRHGGK